jgi:hypothetical protein
MVIDVFPEAGNLAIARAFVQRDRFRLVNAGFQANGLVTAALRDLFDGYKNRSGEAAASVFLPHEHALQFTDAVGHRPQRAARNGEIVDSANEKCPAAAAELRGIDSVNRHAGVSFQQVGVQHRDELGDLGCGRVHFDDGQGIMHALSGCAEGSAVSTGRLRAAGNSSSNRPVAREISSMAC